MPLPDVLELPLAINLLAVFFGALGGALRAGEEEHTDLVGVFTLAAAMGFGGGLVRDLLLGNLPPAAFRDPSYLAVAAGAAGLGMLFLYYLRKLGPVLWPIDTIVIGLFACVGTNAALIADLDLLPAIIIGTIASVGGLILSDVLQGRPSSIMYVGPPNAVAGMAGAAAYALLYTGTRPLISTGIAVVATVLVRLTGPLFHMTVPQPRKRAYDLRVKRRESNRLMTRKRRTSNPSADPVE
ncbi:TRIC cation channel family protein [Demequina sp. TTPB684]|uniref:trimeric intracellular cation channel family protein n=1 Tax=unclassified Demequina TaxID=2620311 RepID=UPI001CF4A1E1|nr:TRIC cation channel family protein [Demequina sp. TMPB413]MCB2412082.1 TRIC cation channel family protein [Demequina sp. TTPB684]UPU88629.1 TRIC cation channel family protein [Demequina sp. TMPB413]